MYGFERIMNNTICYRTVNGEVFLWCVCFMNRESVEERVNMLNTERPAEFMERPIDWTTIVEFFADEQEAFF